MPAPSAASVANWFLDKADEDGFALDQLQIQKLLYFAQGWYLANTGEELFQDDVFAWPHGPVVTSIWQQFRTYGRQPISGRAHDIEAAPDGNLLNARFRIARLNDQQRSDFCAQIWDRYGQGKFTGVQLSNLTHAPEEPWEVVRRLAPEGSRPPIPTGLIRDAFGRKLRAAQA